jgi:DNA-binding NtrC family response regulator
LSNRHHDGMEMRYITPNLQQTLGYRVAALKELAGSLVAELEGIKAVPGLDLNTGIKIRDEVLRYEIDLIRAALRITRNHQRRAAELLGVKVTTLNSKIRRYKISLP